MLKKTITWEDYNGVERKEDFYFNLSKAEIMKMQFSYANGLSEALQKMIDTKNTVELAKMFEELILKAYGEKSDDGRRFIKSKELSTAFSQTEAFSILYMELAMDDKAAAAFVNGIIPSDVAKELAKQQEIS